MRDAIFAFLKNLAEYLFNTQPLSFAVFGILFLITAIFSGIISISIAFFDEKLPIFYRKTARRVKSLCFWYTLLSLIFYFVRQQRLPYLSMRIWLWIYILSFIIIGSIIIANEWKRIPKRREQAYKEMKSKRYFNL